MRLLRFLTEYLLGFLALIVFSAYAHAAGPPTDERWQQAFLLGGGLGLIEIGVLLARAVPANRLILGANLWLIAGGLAVLTEQWWWLLGYRSFGESGLTLAILAVGAVTTYASRFGFVGVAGPPRDVRIASLYLMLGTLLALAAAIHFHGNIKYGSVIPLIALAWLQRLLRHWVARRAEAPFDRRPA